MEPRTSSTASPPSATSALSHSAETASQASITASSPQTSVSPQSSTACAKPGPSGSNEIQLRYKLSLPTYKTLCTIEKSPERRHVLQTACRATEFRSFPIRQAERALFREINDHTAIPYPLGEPVTQPWHKVFLLVQIDLLRSGWPNKISANGRKELFRESGRIYSLLDQVLRCLVDILGQKQDGRGVTVALDVLRSVKAKVWEGNEMELLQVDGIGAAKMRKLVDAGVKTIKQLSSLEFYHVERLLSRNPPFGHQLLHQLSSFPSLVFRVEVISRYSPPSDAQRPGQSEMHDLASSHGSHERFRPESHHSWMVKVVLSYNNESLPTWCKRIPYITLVIEGSDGRLVGFWRGLAKKLTGCKMIVICVDAEKGESLKATMACEDIVGTIVRKTFSI